MVNEQSDACKDAKRPKNIVVDVGILSRYLWTQMASIWRRDQPIRMANESQGGQYYFFSTVTTCSENEIDVTGTIGCMAGPGCI